jgi:hypothetical protein
MSKLPTVEVSFKRDYPPYPRFERKSKETKQRRSTKAGKVILVDFASNINQITIKRLGDILAKNSNTVVSKCKKAATFYTIEEADTLVEENQKQTIDDVATMRKREDQDVIILGTRWFYEQRRRCLRGETHQPISPCVGQHLYFIEKEPARRRRQSTLALRRSIALLAERQVITERTGVRTCEVRDLADMRVAVNTILSGE